jgi:hypothetical protein
MASWGEQMFKGVPFIGQMGNETLSLFDLIGKGILGLTTGQNATGTPEEQQMVQGVLGEATKSTSQEEYDYYKNTGGAGSFSEFLNQPKVPAETIPQAINVMRRPDDTVQNLGIGTKGLDTPAENKFLQDQMLQYGAGNVNPFQRGEALSSLNVSDQARSEIATFLPQMSVDQQEVFLQGVRDGKVSEYELENQSRLRRRGY